MKNDYESKKTSDYAGVPVNKGVMDGGKLTPKKVPTSGKATPKGKQGKKV